MHRGGKWVYGHQCEDNWIGIEEKNLKTIFLKYQRVADAVEGTGIGLYLVKEIVTKAGGHISVENKLAEGSTFKMFLKLSVQ